ncbi:GNS1/SUR4 family domain-containing protein [Ditylenchus destructor]|uniref:Elongation of very long chain fatty acids protein n=1 Tax=Ditylenchus destructor TaxID=166010 RepID=A0AAD4N1F9_9BILA|nr:GNS1/SUR4 family domain-containing protein [Ditylenchus destructor]
MARAEYRPRYGSENYSYVLPMEEGFSSAWSTQWMQDYWQHSVTISIAYVVLIYAGQKYMESKKPFALDSALFWWNMLLAVFSLSGMVRMAPEMFWSVNSNSLVYSICTASFAQGVSGYWTEKFAFSKVFELIDTAFIVARKRPLIFLHWYHHVTVLVYTWHAYKDHTASGRWFVFMNYTVHAFMYTYYALRAMRLRIPKQVAMFITVLQILQMIIGVSIGVTIYRIKSSGGECQQTWSNLYFSFAIYFSYFLLFCNFFYHAYLKRNNRYVAASKAIANEILPSADETHVKSNGTVPTVTNGTSNGTLNVSGEQDNLTNGYANHEMMANGHLDYNGNCGGRRSKGNSTTSSKQSTDRSDDSEMESNSSAPHSADEAQASPTKTRRQSALVAETLIANHHRRSVKAQKQ